MLAAVCGDAALAATTTVVTADRMLDVLTGRMVDRPAVVVVDGRIKAVLAQGDAGLPAGRHATSTCPARRCCPA